MRILLDMDGVLADFVGGAAKLIGFDPALVTEWDFYPAIGETEDSFWKKISKGKSLFWEQLEEYPWSVNLITACNITAPTIILTAPSKHRLCKEYSSIGKMRWMSNRWGPEFDDYYLGTKKEFCASPDSVLIDDNDKNCERFQQAGGRAILFPQPWNQNRDIKDKVAFVMERLNYISETVAK